MSLAEIAELRRMLREWDTHYDQATRADAPIRQAIRDIDRLLQEFEMILWQIRSADYEVRRLPRTVAELRRAHRRLEVLVPAFEALLNVVESDLGSATSRSSSNHPVT